MINKKLFSIFRTGSRTYFYSSLFFPPEAQKDVFSLYAFVRKADNFVDVIPQKSAEFYAFKEETLQALQGGETQDIVIESFVSLSKKFGLEDIIATDFLTSMELDLTKKKYANLKETEEYIYGSAEVIGIAMARILQLPEKALPFARLLGKAMQYANFIRDIQEDNLLGRIYLPYDEMQSFGLESLEHSYAIQHTANFNQFILAQIARFDHWQAQAEKGFDLIPKRYLIPIKTASDMYKWTMQKIAKDPMIVYRVKVKPSINRIVGDIAYNSMRLK